MAGDYTIGPVSEEQLLRDEDRRIAAEGLESFKLDFCCICGEGGDHAMQLYLEGPPLLRVCETCKWSIVDALPSVAMLKAVILQRTGILAERCEIMRRVAAKLEDDRSLRICEKIPECQF